MTSKPNLFIIGAPKCGTTAWYEYLRRHEDICFSDTKEPHFFSTDFAKFRWARTESEYLELYESQPPAKYIGDASIMHLYSAVASENIYAFNPDAKVLIFVRRYDSFYQSYHSQLVLMHDETEVDLERAWKLQSIRATGASIPATCREPRFLEYKQVASFGAQIQRTLNSFPKDQVKVIVFEEWTKDPGAAYADILQFLDLKDDGFNDFKAVNEKRRDRSRLLGKLLYRPPASLLTISRLFKKAVALDRLNVAATIRKFNQATQTTRTRMSPELSKNILAHCREDRILLESLLDREITAWNAP